MNEDFDEMLDRLYEEPEPIICPNCNGTGRVTSRDLICPYCGGSGHIGPDTSDLFCKNQ